MARLSDQERREVIRFVEAGKPLPEKYRFPLFDDERQVELVWNGKTDEVTNVVLTFQVIEQVGGSWAEKSEDTMRFSSVKKIRIGTSRGTSMTQSLHSPQRSMLKLLS